MSRLAWGLARLRRIHPGEIPARLGQQLWLRLPPAAPDPGPRRRCPLPAPPPEGPRAELGPFLRHGHEVLGSWIEPRHRACFHRDPQARTSWPVRSGHRLDLLGSPQDPRRTWELGRLQHLAWLSAAGPEARPAIEADLSCWIAQHPPGRGLGWASTLEVALRLVSLVQIGGAFPSEPLWRSVAAHAAWLIRHPSVGSSARNHRIAELGALALASEALPDASGARRWRRAAARLPGALAHQLHPDGVGIEQSTAYLAFVIEWGLLARALGIEGLDPALRRATRFLLHLVDASGEVVSLGDSDDGRVLATTVGPEIGYVRSVIAAAAAVLGLPAPGGERSDDPRHHVLRVPAARPWRDPGSRTFPQGGLTVLRHRDRVVVFDHGPLGEPDLGAHGHADALSVWVHLGSGPLVVGRGTGQYNADPPQRRFARGSRAHPTVVIDGIDQSEPHTHPFLWRSRARARLLSVDPGAGQAIAEHDGYLARLGVVHRRSVALHDDHLVLLDTLEGSGRRHVAIVLPLAPELRARPGPGGIELLSAGQHVTTVVVDPRCRARIVRGGARPGPGWHSPRYGVQIPATTVSLEARPWLPVTLRTELWFCDPGPRDRTALQPPGDLEPGPGV